MTAQLYQLIGKRLSILLQSPCTEQAVTTVRIVYGGCLIRNVCTVGTERPGAVRSVLYREAMVVLGEA